MNLPLWLENLAAYSLQVLAVVSVAGALAALFRLQSPRVMLVYWQAVLAVCLLLPWIQPREQDVIPYAATAAPAAFSGASEAAAPAPKPFPIYETAAAVLVAGFAARLAWLGLGMWRLRLYRRRAQPLTPIPAPVEEMRSRVGVSPDLYLSSEVAGPASFGLLRPAILFPAGFPEMACGAQRALACHELIHVRRRDWLWALFEEVVRSALWFHPAVWWLLGRIQLAREQAVDRLVVEMTGARGPYVEALLEVASVRAPLAAPAPLFLRKRQFAQRLEMILKEVSVSRTRVVFSLAGMLALLVAAGGVTVWSLPLRAEPVFAPAQADSSQPPQKVRVGGNVQQSKLIHQVRPQYPPLAKQARIQGTVRLTATIAKDGSVRHVEVVSGHPLLIEAAMEAVRQWRYQQTLLNGEPVEVVTLIDVNFTLEGGPGAEAVTQSVESPGFSLEEPGQAQRIRVGAAVEQRKLLYSPEPLYPPLAQQARIQGTVRLEVLIAADGAVKQVRLISGHPMLAGAVLEAVKKWRYRPTLLDGEPVEVVTQVEVRLPPGVVAPEPKAGETYRVGEGVKRPVLIHKVEPVYTQEARDAKLEGKVVALIEVGADGVIRNVEIVKPLGMGLDEKAVEALRQWRFQPAEKDGQPVAVKASIEMSFRLY